MDVTTRHRVATVIPSLVDRLTRLGNVELLAADHLKKHPLKMMSTLTIVLNHLKEEEEEGEERNSTKKH